MDDIKLFSKNEKVLETLIQAVRIYSQDIGMEFSTEKSVMLIMKSRKGHRSVEIELPNQEKIRTPRKRKLTNTWKVDAFKNAGMKEKKSLNKKLR